MSTILAVDLAFSGPTGYVVWNPDLEILLDYGEIKPESSNIPGAITYRLYRKCRQMIAHARNYHDIEVVVFEIPDWFQKLNNNDSQFNRRYKRERVVQQRLGQARSVFELACINTMKAAPIPLGVSTIRDHLSLPVTDTGSTYKMKVAAYLALRYSDWFIIDNGVPAIVQGKKINRVGFNVSDAIALAVTQGDYMRTNELAGTEIYRERMFSV